MRLPIQITFRNTLRSDSIEAYVRARAKKLESISGRITGCQVVVEAPHRHQRRGRPFRVRLDLTIPGGEIVVSHSPAEDSTNEDAYAAIDDAFDRLGRRLEDHVRRRRGTARCRARPTLRSSAPSNT